MEGEGGRNNGRLIGEKYLELLVCERAVCGIFLDIPGGRNYSIDFFEHFETFVKKKLLQITKCKFNLVDLSIILVIFWESCILNHLSLDR